MSAQTKVGFAYLSLAFLPWFYWLGGCQATAKLKAVGDDPVITPSTETDLTGNENTVTNVTTTTTGLSGWPVVALCGLLSGGWLISHIGRRRRSQAVDRLVRGIEAGGCRDTKRHIGLQGSYGLAGKCDAIGTLIHKRVKRLNK